MEKYRVGIAGEDACVKFLTDNGYRILERRYRAGHLETDIIATDGKYIVFTEVKARRTLPGIKSPYGTPSTAVNRKKAENLIACAEEYLRSHKEETKELYPRIDVVEVYFDPREDIPVLVRLNHIRGAINKHTLPRR